MNSVAKVVEGKKCLVFVTFAGTKTSSNPRKQIVDDNSVKVTDKKGAKKRKMAPAEEVQTKVKKVTYNVEKVKGQVMEAFAIAQAGLNEENMALQKSRSYMLT